MKKLSISLLVICAVLFSAVYFIGEMTENEIQKIFVQNKQQGFSGRLLSYHKQFFTATAVSEVSLMLKDEQPMVFTVKSVIRHYPYKAVINNEIRLLDTPLARTVQDYFGSENWITSKEEINLFAQLSGHLQLLPGRYRHAREQFATKALQMDYHIDLNNYSGNIDVNWEGLDTQSDDSNMHVESIKLRSDFSALSGADKYDYSADIGKVVIRKNNTQSQLQGIALRGSSRPGKLADTVDSSHQWKVASYQMDDAEQLFTDNQLNLVVKGLYSPALVLLNNAADDPQQVTKALTELLAHGAQLSLTKLRSETPWGKVHGVVDLSLQQGGRLSQIIANPFMLLDYISGRANFYLPDALLQQPEASELLSAALQGGLLKRREQTLCLEAQFEQGELTVNGRIIPL
ncbi:MAG: YdgA family protein [Psychromonas sp.]|nr:YdgA family protein [Psychromonas sp.]